MFINQVSIIWLHRFWLSDSIFFLLSIVSQKVFEWVRCSYLYKEWCIKFYRVIDWIVFILFECKYNENGNLPDFYFFSEKEFWIWILNEPLFFALFLYLGGVCLGLSPLSLTHLGLSSYVRLDKYYVGFQIRVIWIKLFHKVRCVPIESGVILYLTQTSPTERFTLTQCWVRS